MKKRIFRVFAVAVLCPCVALAASVLDSIPVYGAACVAIEDGDLLKDTVLGLGVLAVTPGEVHRVFIGDGLTPGGIEIHPANCVRDFRDIHVATTNLDMGSYHITFGPWHFSGDAREFDATWGGVETWMRFVRDIDNAYLAYDFTIGENNTYTFAFNWSFTNGSRPVLQVSTNLLEGYFVPPAADTVYTFPSISRIQIAYTAPADAETLFFRIFAASRMDTGIYFSYPVNVSGSVTATTTNGAVVLDNNSVRVLEYDTHGGGGLTASAWLKPDGLAHQLLYNYWTYNFPSNSGTLALKSDVTNAVGELHDTVFDWVDDVAGDLAAHAAATNNPHGVTLPQAVDASEETFDYLDTEWGLGISSGDGVSSLHGFGHSIGFEEGYIDGEFDFYDRPSYDGNGLATTNEVAAVENRVADLEEWRDWPETCCLYWPVGFVVSNSVITTNYTVTTNEDVVVTNATVLHTFSINKFVTNCPTRRLELTIRDKGIEKLNIKFDPKWKPASPKEININVISSSGTPTNRSTRVMLNNTESHYVVTYTAYNQYRDVTLSYDPGSPYYWRVLPRARQYVSIWFASGSGSRTSAPTEQPETIEEWIALQQGENRP